MTEFLPPAEYYARLPKNIAGAGAVFHDDGRMLLVRPVYRADTPGRLLARRLRACAAALADGGSRYLHDGQPIR